jgi:glucose-1-phosphate thymidylyltransferase
VDSYLGPYTSIYFGCRIEKAEIEHSVVLENSLIIDVPQRIEESLIGRNVRIGRGCAKPAAYKLVLGDHSNLDMP